MLDKYKKIFQTQDDTISETCVEFVSFTYNPPSGICVENQATLNFNYVDCAGDEQTVNYLVACDAGIYELLTPLCVREGSVVVFGAGSGSLIAVQYGLSCP